MEGTSLAGAATSNASPGTGRGGGLVITAPQAEAIRNTTVAGNLATTSDNDVLIGPIALVRVAVRHR
jgi:hypothetical protein